jgi:hypothetical protein
MTFITMPTPIGDEASTPPVFTCTSAIMSVPIAT